MSSDWFTRKKPAQLERRIEFSDYQQTRDFLERVAELSESEGYYPDMSFGRTHVSITLRSENDVDEVSEDMLRYATQVDQLIPDAKQSID
ncbi:MAG: 4a-hydroxytetrahydrobiopterin dehydratase [Gammaproteobacteria bacterium]|nr:4a-hydroxytetrahydrobiopterin dehydratase [Gammaproteobacteria bacterium]MCF6260007.1 4a-hydroxytetrahydrobiopterin dehydratase [Gammaproteobacteria bacterium]